MKTYEAKIFDVNRYELGEGPYFDPRYNRLSWVDIMNNKLVVIKDGIKEIIDLEKPTGAAVPLSDSEGFLLASSDGLYIYENGVKTLYLDMKDEFGLLLRSNDCKADPMGRLFFGSSLLDDGEPFGKFYSYDGMNLTIIEGDTKIANGMAWNKDRTKMYFCDSPYGVFEYDYDVSSGKVSNRKLIFTFEGGTSDGMCIDSDDNLWIAIWGGSRVECRSTKTGEILSIINVPATQVTSCCFYGDKMNQLLITTAAVGLEGEYEGRIFTCTVDATGVVPDYARITR